MLTSNKHSCVVDHQASEHFPNDIIVQFEEISGGHYPKVKVTLNDVQIGDVIDDNSYSDDGYRYHDVFHYTFATLLEWSPCSRSMLKIKRKSNCDLDRIEDGARAAITEEAISLMLFNYAANNNYLYNCYKIDDTLLDIIKNMTQNFEVGNRSKREWEVAILKSYELFRSLKENRGGIIKCDLENKHIAFHK